MRGRTRSGEKDIRLVLLLLVPEVPGKSQAVRHLPFRAEVVNAAQDCWVGEYRLVLVLLLLPGVPGMSEKAARRLPFRAEES